MQTLLNTK